jgi:nucleoside-diphosphate-sugar epimerase
MRIAITGAGGFLGAAIGHELVAYGFNIVLIYGPHRKPPSTDNTYSLDLADERSFRLLERLEKLDAVVHAAGLAHQFSKVDAGAFERINVGGAVNTARWAKDTGIRRFIHISSVAVYGPGVAGNPHGHDEKAACNPQGAYATSKLKAEREVDRVLGDSDTTLTILRPATIIGEEDKGNVRRLIEVIDRGRFIRVGPGTNVKNLIYRDDVARACRMTITENCGQGIFNVAGDGLTMNEIVNTIFVALGKSPPSFHLPTTFIRRVLSAASALGNIPGLSAAHETMRKWHADDDYSGEKMLDACGFKPAISAVEGIQREVKWYLNHKKS